MSVVRQRRYTSTNECFNDPRLANSNMGRRISLVLAVAASMYPAKLANNQVTQRQLLDVTPYPALARLSNMRRTNVKPNSTVAISRLDVSHLSVEK